MLAATHAYAEDLIVSGSSTVVTLAGIRRYDHVCVVNGGTLNVAPYAGNKATGGNLELIASTIFVDSTSTISARGAGYTTPLCSDGEGPTATAGGRGGCSVMDSGGGGAHFGRGGRGTVDGPTGSESWQGGFPSGFEDDCDLDFNSSNLTCEDDGSNASRTLCCDDSGGTCIGPSVAGTAYWHNIYAPEFGAAGGDKGCRDGDGRDPNHSDPVSVGRVTGGSGGGRLVLVGLSERLTGSSATAPAACGTTLSRGQVRIEGTIDASGKRGCGIGNDSGGGGGGGSILIVGDDVTVTSNARVSAAGGLGGDTRSSASNQPNHEDCVGLQGSGTCDDCGGGGGGGIISVLSKTRQLQAGPRTQFDVSGANGGTCGSESGDAVACQGEAGGGAGELQLDGAYIGEFCDGFDNDFDGLIDEAADLGTQSCGLGDCAATLPACTSGAPVSCVPDVSKNATCKVASENARPRIAVIVDTSASMLLDLNGYPTFGDGSVEHPSIDTPADTGSRLYLADEALSQVISAYPEIDFALARYHQDQGENRSCQTATWFECQGLIATYDRPDGNTGSEMCEVEIGPDPDGSGPQTAPTVTIRQVPDVVGGRRTECINYAGSCGAPRRGADVLSGFGTPARDMVRWMDHKEEAISPAFLTRLAATTPGDVCLHSQGGDCELRASGPTPLAGSLQAIEDYITPIRTTDGAAACRGYSVILVTDGAESCNGNPAAAAKHLHDMGVDVSVVAVSVLDSEKASLNAIAANGGTTEAVFVTEPERLVPALTSIIAKSIRTESCNGQDDDCDGRIDEDFPGLGNACDNRMKGVCRGEGKIACNAAGDGTECKITSEGQSPQMDEVCNGLDDDCDGAIDEALTCKTGNCMPRGAEQCNGVDDDCDGKVDESDPRNDTECGSNVGECRPGKLRCVAGSLRCTGAIGPQPEQCNGKDDDCDGLYDDMAPCPDATVCIEGACRNPCGGSEFGCPYGHECVALQEPPGEYCLPRACALCKSTERCVDDMCVDPCADVSCDDGLICVRGSCRDCTVAGCGQGQVCYQQLCQPNPCASTRCSSGDFCYNGDCLPRCEDARCPTGQSCNAVGTCSPDPCVNVACGSGEVCSEGQCVPDLCVDLICPSGKVCISALGCIDDPCTITACPEGTLCSVGPQGAPRCIVPGTPTKRSRPTFVSTGGAGLTSCSVGAPGASGDLHGFGWFLAGVALLALRRSRRQRRAAQVASAATAIAACAWLSGCQTGAICLDCVYTSSQPGSDASTPDDDGGGGLIHLPDGSIYENAGSGGNGMHPSTCTKLGDEVCNRLDDDCDGTTDEGFDFMTDVRHCGGCDKPCGAENSEASCEAGVCVVKGCSAGFADFDGERGCEYRCPVFPVQAEDCNGVDDDCDGRVDEGLGKRSGAELCRNTAGSPCENVQVVCDTREDVTGWFCDYPAVVEFDRSILDGIRPEESLCDGNDNDCDGAVDEVWPVGQACDDGKLGACRDGGIVVCTDDHKNTRCDLSVAPDAVPASAEVCNDIDDDCDGIVDNATGDNRVIDDMVKVERAGHPTFYIYKYEASRADAKVDSSGIVPGRACSRAGVLPWSHVSYAAANAACAASGKRLCTSDEWQWACEGSLSGRVYPYGTTSASSYVADRCNGADHDVDTSDADIDNAIVRTGSLAMCTSTDGAYDLSGNLKEWVSTVPDANAPNTRVIRGGSFESPRLGLTCQTTLSQAESSTVLGGLGFRCCSDAAP